MSRTEWHRQLAGSGLVALTLLAAGCNKAHVYAKQASQQEAAFFVARQPPMYELMQPSQMRWGMFGFPTLAKLVTFTNWSLVVEAFDH